MISGGAHGRRGETRQQLASRLSAPLAQPAPGP